MDSSKNDLATLTAVEREKLLAEKPLMLVKLQEQLNIELKVQAGAETMLQVSETGQKGGTISREQVEEQLTATRRKIASLQKQIDMYRNLPDETGTSSQRSGPRPDEGDTFLRQRRSTMSLGGRRQARTASGQMYDITGSDICAMRGLDTQTLNEYLNHIEDAKVEVPLKLEAMSSLLRLIKDADEAGLTTHAAAITSSLRFCLTDSSKDLRACTYRVLRHLAISSAIMRVYLELNVDVFIMRSLARDQRYDAEREQALKLVRAFLDVREGALLLPQNLVRMLVAIAEQPDDKFRNVCLETLCELAVRNMPILALCGGTKVLFNALLDGPRDLTCLLVKTILYILDSDATRCYMRPSVELEMIISQFTDAYSRGPANEDRLTTCAKAVTLLFKSWTGIIYLCLDNKRAIRSIVESLRLPYEENRKILLEMFFEVFQIDVPKWYPDFVSARSRFANYYPMHEDLLREKTNHIPLYFERPNLVDHYLSVVLLVFIEVGLIEALVELLQHDNKYITTRVTILVGEILELCNRLLPTSYGTKVQSLPALFRIAADFADEPRRHQGTLALSYIDRLHKSKDRLLPHDPMNTRRLLARRFENNRRAEKSRQVESVKIKMGIQIDDVHFRTILGDLEKVLGSREYTKWNWDSIMELIQGPLLNPKRLEETVKNSRVLKRIMSFYRPLNNQFSAIKRSKGTAKYIRIGCELMKTLLSTPDGIRYLSENKLLPEIAECLGHLDPMHPTSQTEPLFSRDRMEKTLTGDYFTLLGIFTQSSEGIRLLEKFRIFSLLYRLTELRSRDDLVKAIITSLDYNRDTHARVLLSKVMTSGYKPVRLASTNHLRHVLQTGVADFWDWGIQLLVTQLYDPSIEVCEKAVAVLDLACNDRRNLESVVNMRPSLDHLGDAGNPLLLRFLATSVGFDYLQQLDYIEPEMDYWFQYGNKQYAVRLELSLARALSSKPGKPAAEIPSDVSRSADELGNQDKQDADGSVPPHFYGELTRTHEGCELLRQKGHFSVFTELIRKKSNGVVGDSEVLQLKSVLWAVGNIGSTASGLPFLLGEDIIKHIVAIAYDSPIITLKGTCYYVLGLISRTPQGMELLDDLGWDTVTSSPGELGGLCLPKDPARFLTMPKWSFKGSWPEYTVQPPIPPESFDATALEILKSVGNMSNHILANAASKALSRMRHECPKYFSSVDLYIEVFAMLSVYHFRLSARRFIHELFERVSFADDRFECLKRLEQMKIEGPDPFVADLATDRKLSHDDLYL
ncbi:Rapamycin-insensitive companion of mTOR, N-term-domain-containing protein [Gaertneriomyces semiglobifer]|nr:Rapamycin-insensitive companion of mTOR, N-term-domain-containing protein [Gaertneriomyces semiglobifer]